MNEITYKTKLTRISLLLISRQETISVSLENHDKDIKKSQNKNLYSVIPVQKKVVSYFAINGRLLIKACHVIWYAFHLLPWYTRTECSFPCRKSQFYRHPQIRLHKHIGITINHANCTHQIVKYNYASFSFNHKTVMEGVGRFIYNR